MPRQNFLLQNESSHTNIGCKRCWRFFKNILARQESIAPVNLLISLNKLYILLQCFSCRFQLVNIWCIIWSISRLTSSHLTFLVVIQIWCLYLGDMREKYVWCSTILLDFNKIYMQQNACLNSLQQPFFQSVLLEQYAGTIHVKVHPLQKCFGLVDSTAKEIIRS